MADMKRKSIKVIQAMLLRRKRQLGGSRASIITLKQQLTEQRATMPQDDEAEYQLRARLMGIKRHETELSAEVEALESLIDRDGPAYGNKDEHLVERAKYALEDLRPSMLRRLPREELLPLLRAIHDAETIIIRTLGGTAR